MAGDGSVRYLIINADGYGFTAGVTRAIEECVDFGTVRSISVNVNFEHAVGLPRLLARHSELSVGCHVNPIVGPPVLPADKVPTLVNEQGEFHYQQFTRRFLTGRIKLSELRAEMMAQVDKTRGLAGEAFSHIDFHMGLHRLPRLYDVFLDVVEDSGVKRMRTHRYLVGVEGRHPRLRYGLQLAGRPVRLATLLWNLWLRRKAVARGFQMPARRVFITRMGAPGTISVSRYIDMLQNLPAGVNEFVAHPGYVDESLARWSSYRQPRVLEREVLLSLQFREALQQCDVRLIGYRDLPTQHGGAQP